MLNVMTERHVTAAACGILLVVAAASRVNAECVGFPLQHYKQYADLVFSGTVVELQQPDSERTIVGFQVDRVWKGNIGKRVVVHQQLDSLDSLDFTGAGIGHKYLVFATRLNREQRVAFGLSEIQPAFGIPSCGGGTHRIDADARCCGNSVAVESRVDRWADDAA